MMREEANIGPIGVFDSGYGGLTVLKSLQTKMPEYDFLYLGDNARNPYGTRSFEVVYEFTRQAVFELFERGCHLVILACNTASAKALRNIQQIDLPQWYPERRVLGVIRPTTENLGFFSKTRHVGILATQGTVQSGSYSLELSKFFPDLVVTEKACPMWVPLIENAYHQTTAGEMILKEDLCNLLKEDQNIDNILLACTHYPLVMKQLEQWVPNNVTIMGQGDLVADRLLDYLKRHPEIDKYCSKKGILHFMTTENARNFEEKAAIFYDQEVVVEKIRLR